MGKLFGVVFSLLLVVSVSSAQTLSVVEYRARFNQLAAQKRLIEKERLSGWEQAKQTLEEQQQELRQQWEQSQKAKLSR